MFKKTVGEMVFELRAEVAQLRRDMTVARSIAKRGADDIEAAFKTLRRGIEVALGGTLITALTKAFTSAVHDLASLKGAAETAGTSVENLSRTLGVAAEAGIGVEKVVSIVTKLNQSILAAQTNKRAESAWAVLGINPAEFKDATDLLVETARALDQFAEGPRKSQLAIALLGRAGADAIPFLKDLAEAGLEGARVTSEQAKQADALEKAFLRLQYEAGMAKTQLASEFVPVLLEIVQHFNEARRAGFDFADALASSFKGPEQAAADAAKELGKLTLLRAELARKVETGDTSIWDFVLGSPEVQDERLRQRMEVAAQQLDRWVKVLQRRADDQARQIASDQVSFLMGPKPDAPLVLGGGARSGPARDPNAAILREIESLRERATQVERNSAYEKALYEVQSGRHAAAAKWAQQELLMSALIVDAKKREVDAEKERIDALEQEAAAERRAWGGKSAQEIANEDLRARLQAVNSLASRSDRGRLEEINRMQADMTDLLERGLIEPETWSRAFGVAEGMKQTKDEFTAGFQELIKAVDGLGKQTAQAFADWLFGGSGSLKDVVIRGSKEIVAAIAYQQFFKGASDSAVQSILGLFGAGPTGSALDSGPWSTGGVNIVQLGGAFAAGGDYAAGRPILVGERGPELMMPRSAGTVIPNHALGGGVTINNTITIQGGGSRAQVERGLSEMQRAVVGIVADAKSRGMLGTTA